MKIIICGAGRVGTTLVEQLSSERYDLTVIDRDRAVMETISEEYDVMALRGNAASMNVLSQAGVKDADLLIAATGNDEVNLLCCMTAHFMNPSLHTIARVSSPEYATQAYTMQNAFALSLAFNPEKQAADEIEHLLRFPGFLKRDTFAKGRIEIVEIKVERGSRLCDVALSELGGVIRQKILVCTALRDGRAFIPTGNFVIREGDRIFVTAPTNALSALLTDLGAVPHRAKHIIIVGGSTVGFYLARMLRGAKLDVTIIERDPAVCNDLAALLPGVNIIHGDACNRDVLESEGLSESDALVAVTGQDETNIIVSLYGERFGVPQIITKLDALDDSRIISALPIGSVICPCKLSCNTVVRYVRAMKNQAGAALTIHTIADDQAEAIEFPVDASTLHRGVPLRNIRLRENILIGGIARGGSIEIPSGDSCFMEGDSVVIVYNGDEVLLQLNDIFV